MYRGGNTIFFLTSGSCRMLGMARFGISSWKSIPLHQMLLSKSAIPHIQKTGILGLTALLSKKEAYHFKVNRDYPVLFVILQQRNESLYVSMFFIKKN